MKLTTIILLGFLALWGCNKKNNSDKNSISKKVVLSNDSLPKTSIKVFRIVYDSTYLSISEKLPKLNKSLTNQFKESKYVKDKEYINEWIQNCKDKDFAKVLAKDFENYDFTKTTQIDVSFLTYQQKYLGEVKIEEWSFREEYVAISCINAFKNYWEREIHFKSINWIWIQQKNKLFFISTIDYRTSSKPMQTIKQNLINILKKQGEYNIIEMY
jgi:hypothetical protein